MSVDSTKTLWSSEAENNWFGRPYFMDDGARWAVVYRRAFSHAGAGSTQIRFSTDQGVTWTAENVFTDSNPVTGAPFTAEATYTPMNAQIVKAANGDILVHQFEWKTGAGFGTRQFRSTDSGATFSDEGIINSDEELAFYDVKLVGSVLYAAGKIDAGADTIGNNYSVCYKSDDNGATWTLAGNITTTTEDTNETTIEYIGGSSFIAIARGSNKTYFASSTDNGANWSIRDITANIGIIQKPFLRTYAGRMYLVGRLVTATENACVLFSDDLGQTWSTHYIPDATEYSDTGYCDLIRRGNGKLYMLNYGGASEDIASMLEYVFSIS